jgi:L-malate glycosyltransferase
VTKVLHLIDSFNQGGSESQAVQLTRLLHESGDYQVHVACLNSKGVLKNGLAALGYIDIPEFPLNNFHDANAVRQLRRFAKFLRDNQIAIVHTHDFYTNIFGTVGAALARIPVRVASRRESAKRAAVKRMVERSAYKLADAIVANCDIVRQQLIDEGVPASKIVTIHNGLDIQRLEPNCDFNREEVLLSFKLPSEPARRFVTIVANLRTVKDHPTFLRAAARVRERVHDAAFIIAGEGELLDSLSALADQLGLKRDVFFVGRCENIASLLAVSHVCVLSSLSEGFSNSILEYMAAARPVVATDVGGACEAVIDGETGYLVPAGSSEIMAERIISLMQDSEKAQEMGKKGKRLATDRFSCKLQLQRTEELYRRLLESAKAERRGKTGRQLEKA